MKVSDYIAHFIRDLGIRHVFGVVGGGSMHLNDSFREVFIACHHEQAAAMAAEAYARISGIGCCLVTTGPGGTNAITGLACAWVDSIPVIFISGQVTTNTLIGSSGVRQMGIQETDIVSIVAPLTKHCERVTDPKRIRYELEKAAHLAKSGRPGPVWLDIPLDIQAAEITPDALDSFHDSSRFRTHTRKPPFPRDLEWAVAMLAKAERPVLICGNGIHLANAEDDFGKLVNMLEIPVVSSWTAADLIETGHSYYVGRCGLFGDRASNLAAQRADVILAIGCRLSIAQTGHDRGAFAPDAEIIMVDVDRNEMHCHLPIVADAGEFIRALLPLAHGCTDQQAEWLGQCQAWKEAYPVVAEQPAAQDGYINSAVFVDQLCDLLPDDAIVVTCMGSSFTSTFQAATIKRGQRWITASGHAPMGYGIPGAIGAHYASGRPVIAIVGDGGAMFNLQELATIAHRKLPITIFVLDNQGYLTMKHTFQNHFGRQVGSDPDSGVWIPNLWAVANTMGIDWSGVISEVALIRPALGVPAPSLWQVMMDPIQPLIPRVQTTRNVDGSMTPGRLENMFPYIGGHP